MPAWRILCPNDGVEPHLHPSMESISSRWSGDGKEQVWATSWHEGDRQAGSQREVTKICKEEQEGPAWRSNIGLVRLVPLAHLAPFQCKEAMRHAVVTKRGACCCRSCRKVVVVFLAFALMLHVRFLFLAVWSWAPSLSQCTVKCRHS